MRADEVTSHDETPLPDMSRSSRATDGGAGWGCRQRGRFTELMPPEAPRFSWLRPPVLWRSRNDVLAHLIHDPTDETRNRWVAAQRERGVDPDFRVEVPPMAAPTGDLAAGPAEAPETGDREGGAGAADTGLGVADPGHPGAATASRSPEEPASSPLGEEFSFLLLGDTGEGDMSQYAVVPCLLAKSEGTAFAIIASDVIYPEGGIDGYADKFFRPYQHYPRPIYALPGNHDWYDDLAGFMRVFCDAPPLPRRRTPVWPLRPWLRSLLWRRPTAADESALAEAMALRGAPEQRSRQPGPYWMIDTPSLRIIGIDPGISGTIDAAQGEWLRRVSRGPKPKMLITGKPIYRDNKHYPCPIDGGGTVDDIVRDPDCGFVAAIGGDIHNYQRYPVRVGDRTIQYVVAGGGGAFMHATHQIPRITVAGVDERDFRCYPLRGDSLSFYSQLYDRRLRTRGLLAISPTQAAAYMAERLGSGASPRLGDAQVKVTRRTRIAAWILGRLPVGRAFRRWFSEFSDWDHPPFFKSFLRIDVTRTSLRLRCFAATGCLEHESDPPLEDEVTVALTPPRVPAPAPSPPATPPSAPAAAPPTPPAPRAPVEDASPDAP